MTYLHLLSFFLGALAASCFFCFRIHTLKSLGYTPEEIINERSFCPTGDK